MNRSKLVEYEITDENNNTLAIIRNTKDKLYNIKYTDLGIKSSSYNNIHVQSLIYESLFEMKKKGFINMI
jgi:hypothetical protein